MTDKPKPLKIQATGDLEKSKNADGTLALRSRGTLALEFDTIRSIGLENLLDVETYTITQVFNSVSHFVRFHGGGEVRFSYNAEGKLMEFSASNVGAQVAGGDRIVLRKAIPEPEKKP